MSNDDAPAPDSSPLDQYLGKGVLAGKGYAFEAAGKKYGVDPTLLAAISAFESGYGNSPSARLNNNVMGEMVPSSPDQKQHQKFASVDDSIDAGAKILSNNYLQKGLTTIPQIAAVYSPVRPDGTPVANDREGTNWQWPGSVQKIYSKMGGENKFFGPQSTGIGVNMMGGYPQPPPPSQLRSSPGEKPPPPQPPPVADADSDSSSSSGQLGGHWGAVNV
jgi:hypothetical protein